MTIHAAMRYGRIAKSKALIITRRQRRFEKRERKEWEKYLDSVKQRRNDDEGGMEGLRARLTFGTNSKMVFSKP